MMFEQDEALKRIAVLSGGEKSRVVLGKIIASPVNLLLLDEPTNHLDMESGDALLAALDYFEGAVVIVTHNEMFLHALAERLIVFQGDRTFVYEGDYQRFLEKVGWADEDGLGRADSTPTESADGSKLTKKDLRRLRSAVIAERARMLKPIEVRMSEVEAEIEAKEKELERLNQAVIEAGSGTGGQDIVEMSRTMHGLSEDIEALYAELETLTAEHEKKQAHYDRELASLGG